MIPLRTLLGLVAIAGAALVNGQAPVVSFTATTANVAGSPEPVRIDLYRWSTDGERDKFMAAWNAPNRGAGRGAQAPSGGGRAGRAGRGASAAAAAPDPDALDDVGGSRRPTAAAPTTPECSFSLALQQAATVGYLWPSSGVAGHAIRYAAKLPQPGGADRIILITDRRLGKYGSQWKLKGADASVAYDFSIIELRVNAKGEGEGKASLTGKLALDDAAKILAIENYSALPVVLSNVKPRVVASP